MEKFLNMLPGFTALVLVIGAYWQLKIKAENNEKRISDVKDDCYGKICDERERSDEHDSKHDQELAEIKNKLDKDINELKERLELKASEKLVLSIKSDIMGQYGEVKHEISSLRQTIMEVIAKK